MSKVCSKICPLRMRRNGQHFDVPVECCGEGCMLWSVQAGDCLIAMALGVYVDTNQPREIPLYIDWDEEDMKRTV